MFDLDRFIEDCRAVVLDDPSHRATREVLARANSDPGAILAALGEPTRAGVTPLFGVYTGREDNIFWRRVENDGRRLIEASGAKSLGERCAEPLGRDVIHSVTNPPLGRLTAAIHVYGGDFYGARRSDWDPENLLEREYDFALHRQMFEEANAV